MRQDSMEVTERTNLLSPRGTLVREGWASEQSFIWSRASVPVFRRLTRLKEWCSVTLGNAEVRLTLSIVDAGFTGILLADYVNLRTETVCSGSRFIPLTFGRLELPTSPTEDVIVRAKGASFDMLNSSSGLIVRCRIEDFDDVRPLYANVTLTRPQIGGIYTAQEAGGGFSYEHTRVYSHASGTVNFGADGTELSDGFGWSDWRRSVLPYASHRQSFVLSAPGIALSLGQGWGAPKSAVRCCAGADGELYKLVRADIEKTSDGCHIHCPDGHLDLEFTAQASCPHRVGIPGVLELRRNTVFGTCSGTARLGERRVIIENAAAALGDETGRW